MADVARAANLSRATVYRYFPDREALVMASVVRRARMNMDSARDRIRSRESFAERIVEGIIDNTSGAACATPWSTCSSPRPSPR
jgi:AcrR family transcriptional regulator